MAILKLKNKTTGEWEEIQAIKGNGISSIEKTATVGNKDTYTIYFTNGETTTYEVENGEVTRGELQEEVDRLSMIYNAFPTTTGEGEEGRINGTAKVPFKEIGLKGNTSQESTTGKNLLNIPSSITIPNGYTSFSENINIPAGTYTLSATKITTSGEYPSLIVFRDANGVLAQKTLSSSSLSTTFIVSSDITAIWIYSQDTYEHSQDVSTTFEGLMVSSSGGDYEPYTNGASPNPEYPQDIHVVSGDNTINVTGKNLFDKTSNIVLNKYIGGDGTIQNEALDWYQEDYISVNSSTDYIMSSNASTSVRIALYDKDKNFISRIYSTGSVQVTTTASTKYVRLSGYNNINDNIQLEVGTTNTTYEPYQGNTYPINLPEGMELCKIGDYQDNIVKDNGKWYLNKQIGKVVLNGNEDYWAAGNNRNGLRYFYRTINDKAMDNNVISNKFVNANTWIAQTNINGISGSTNNRTINIMIDDTNVDTEAQFKSWLSTHNVILYYALATPTITEITDTTLIEQLEYLEKAYSYDTQTNISQTNQDKPFIISYEAILSLKNVLNDLETRIAVLETE